MANLQSTKQARASMTILCRRNSHPRGSFTLVFAKFLWYTSSQELVYKKHHLSFFVFGQNVFLHFSKCILYTYKGEQLMAFSQSYDVAIIGGGLPGLSVALRLPGHIRLPLLPQGQLWESKTLYAHGGLTSAVSSDDNP